LELLVVGGVGGFSGVSLVPNDFPEISSKRFRSFSEIKSKTDGVEDIRGSGVSPEHKMKCHTITYS
jgi:hypothetical protein